MVHFQQERYETAAQEDRSAIRLPIPIPATLRPAGSKSLQISVRDVSLSGFSATVLNPVARNTVCWLTLPDLAPVRAKVIWWDNGLMGCAFEQLFDEQMLETLIKRWNAGYFRTER